MNDSREEKSCYSQILGENKKIYKWKPEFLCSLPTVGNLQSVLNPKNIPVDPFCVFSGEAGHTIEMTSLVYSTAEIIHRPSGCPHYISHLLLKEQNHTCITPICLYIHSTCIWKSGRLTNSSGGLFPWPFVSVKVFHQIIDRVWRK